MRRNVAQIVDSLGIRIADGGGKDLFVRCAAVDQVKETHRADLHQAPCKDGDGEQDQHIERVAILGEGTRQKPVIARVLYCTEEYAVKPKNAQFLVELVLVALVGGNLNDSSDPLRRVTADRDVMPWVELTHRPQR